jgi:hypothetical protein
VILPLLLYLWPGVFFDGCDIFANVARDVEAAAVGLVLMTPSTDEVYLPVLLAIVNAETMAIDPTGCSL